MSLTPRMLIAAALLTTSSAHAAWWHGTTTKWILHPAPTAKKMADDLVIQNDGLIDVIFHVTPAREHTNYAVAAYSAHEQGAPSGSDDLDVMTSGRPVAEVQKDGKRIGVLLPLFDVSLHRVGSVGLMFRYHSGDDQKAVIQRAEAIRNEIARQTPSLNALFTQP